jgi:hypothetical protein
MEMVALLLEPRRVRPQESVGSGVSRNYVSKENRNLSFGDLISRPDFISFSVVDPASLTLGELGHLDQRAFEETVYQLLIIDLSDEAENTSSRDESYGMRTTEQS